MTAISPAPVLSFGRVVRSEWIKFRSLRSPAWTLSIAAALVVGFGILLAIGFTEAARLGGAAEATAEFGVSGELGLGVSTATMGVFIAQLAVATLGVLIISGEYSTGMIRSTLVAVPRRTPMLAAKAIVFAVVAFIVGVATTLATFLATNPILATEQLESTLTDPEVLRILLGSGLYLAAIGVLSMAVGAIIRSTAGGIGTIVAMLLIVPIILSMLPWEWASTMATYLPAQAGEQIMMEATETATLGPWQGFGVLLVWVAAALTAAVILLRKRDA
ncbi:ABC transporter permease subunit [Salinibacterium sp. ZJ450]|uniref:ABC transporter permease subunit n=1 Tax=Salinibacterium sp. ZJ450 TaxID=2708338 RepID=UPI001423C006|nr:ABC transporter permease subunit [Salinibacterium sp. ZJ450]